MGTSISWSLSSWFALPTPLVLSHKPRVQFEGWMGVETA